MQYRGRGGERETAPLCRFCFYCTRSFGNTVYPGFNGLVASLRAHRGHTRSASACTKPKVKGCSGSPPPGGPGKDDGLPPDSPAVAHPRPQPWHGSGGCRAPAPYRRLEVSTRRGVIHARVSPRCLNEGRWVAASSSSCNLPPSSPHPETVFLFFPSVPAAPPTTTAGRWVASLGSCLHPAPRRGGQAPQQGSRQRQQLTLNGKMDDPKKRGTDPCELGTGLSKALQWRYRGKAKREDCRLRASGGLPGARGPWPAPPSRFGEVEGSRRQGRKRRREKQGNVDCSWQGSKFAHLWPSSLCCTQRLPLSLM